MNQRTFLIPVTLGASLLLIGCGGGDEPTGVGGGSSTGSTTSATTGTGGAGGGAVAHPWDDAGIQGCAAAFMSADGLCHPRLDACPKGQIPRFEEGCIPVGIPGCADEFLEADGLCHVRMAKCPAGTFASPTEGCVPIDGASGCGAAPFGPIADAAGTIWVDPSYAGGDGDGSKAKPLATITEALGAAPQGGRIALAAGTYDEAISPTKGVEIIGRCPSMVKVTGSAQHGSKLVTAFVGSVPGGVTLRRLQIGGPGVGVFVNNGKATLEEIWVNQATEAAFLASGAGAIVTISRSLFQGTLVRADGTRGDGIGIVGKAKVDVEASAIVEVHSLGASAYDDGTVLTLSHSLIEGTEADANGDFGTGVIASSAGEVNLVGSAVVTSRTTGAGSYFGSSTLNLTDSIVEATRFEQGSKLYGIGVTAQLGAALTLEGSAVLGNLTAGIAVYDKNTTATIERSLIAGTLPAANDGNNGAGVTAEQSGKATLVDSTLAGNASAAASTLGAGSVLTVKSSLFEGTTIAVGGGFIGSGLAIQQSSTLTLDNSALVGNAGFGLLVNTKSSAVMTHSLIEGTLPDSKGNNGGGVFSAGVKSVQITSSLLLSNQVMGIFAAGGPLKLEASVIRGVKQGTYKPFQGQAVAGMGDGLVVIPITVPTPVDVLSSLVEGCERAGMLFTSSGGSISASTSTKNRFGLVLQGTAKPELSMDNVFEANTEMDQVEGGMLSTP